MRRMSDILGDESERLLATGTDDVNVANAQRQAQHTGRKTMRRDAKSCDGDKVGRPGARTETLEISNVMRRRARGCNARQQWPRRGSNPHTGYPIRDFKSRASANSATRPRSVRIWSC